MPYTILIHLLNEDAVVGETEELPQPQDNFIRIMSPRLRDGREVTYLLSETNIVLYPWSRVQSVEVLPTDSEEQVVTFIRE